MRRGPALRALSSDHHKALVLARRALEAARGDDVAEVWQETVRRFEGELEPHFREEEVGLLPALLAAGESALVQRTLHEHQLLRTLMRSGPGTRERLREFGERLQDHVRFEERELFETAQARLPQFGTIQGAP